MTFFQKNRSALPMIMTTIQYPSTTPPRRINTMQTRYLRICTDVSLMKCRSSFSSAQFYSPETLKLCQFLDISDRRLLSKFGDYVWFAF